MLCKYIFYLDVLVGYIYVILFTLIYFLKINIITCYSYFRYVNMKNKYPIHILGCRQDISILGTGYVPKFQVRLGYVGHETYIYKKIGLGCFQLYQYVGMC